MVEVFEAIMLICFGLSWPVSLVKNIQLKSAKTMNLYFTLLIITGYISGIIAKFMAGKITYVLFIYFLNLVVVSCNVVVYFINRRYDKKNEQKENAQSKESQ